MNDYKALRTFLLAAEKRNFAQVARELDPPPLPPGLEERIRTRSGGAEGIREDGDRPTRRGRSHENGY